MNTISAIETRYKGYRFRSRLEARWAMFFDRIGVAWTYEPQPLSVNEEAYLPDFILSMPTGEVVHEVKSLHEWPRIQPKRAYLAGKMSVEHEWRGEAGVTMREARRGAYDTTEWPAAEFLATMGGAAFVMAGPFPVADDHGGGHSSASLHMVPVYSFDRQGIAVACIRAISDADVLCAHISTPDAFGSLVEIGMAIGMGKPTSVTVSHDMEEALRRECGFDHADDDSHELWFCQAAASAASTVLDADAARAFHGRFINRLTPREYRLIAGIGAQRPAVMTFGDPLDVANHRQIHRWGADLIHLCHSNRAAAEAVRAHRFDGR